MYESAGLNSAEAPREGACRSAFTLVELLTVIAIITLLVTLFFPAVQASREKARQTQCVSNLKQIGLAVHLYADSKKRVPQAWIQDRGNPRTTGTLFYFLLPYLEQDAVFDLGATGPSRMLVASHVAGRAVVPTFLCPSLQPIRLCV